MWTTLVLVQLCVVPALTEEVPLVSADEPASVAQAAPHVQLSARDPYAGSFRTREWVFGGLTTAGVDAVVGVVGEAMLGVAMFGLLMRNPFVMFGAAIILGVVALADLVVTPLLATLVEQRVAGEQRAGTFKRGILFAYLVQTLAAGLAVGLVAGGKNTAGAGVLSWFVLHNLGMPLAASFGLHHGDRSVEPSAAPPSSAPTPSTPPLALPLVSLRW